MPYLLKTPLLTSRSAYPPPCSPGRKAKYSAVLGQQPREIKYQMIVNFAGLFIEYFASAKAYAGGCLRHPLARPN